jgi:hypothetical protein
MQTMKRKYFLLVFLFGFVMCSENESSKRQSQQLACPELVLADAESISIFPASNPWNTDISSVSVDSRSADIIEFLDGGTPSLKADFGSGVWDGIPLGIPFMVVCGEEPKVPIIFRANGYDDNYGSESDPGPYPIPRSAQIEADGDGDSHVIAVDVTNHILYELYNAESTTAGWECSSAAKFDLKINDYRQEGWTSADGAGLPIFPGLVRYDEVESGIIDHAIRFTLSRNKVAPSHTFPARHTISGNNVNTDIPTPIGMRLRLKLTDEQIATYSVTNQVILKAMKKYGIILADIGSDFYFSGTEDERWDNDDLQDLSNVTANDFEVIQIGEVID